MVDHFGLVEAVDRFGQRVIVAIALATDRRLDTGLRQTLCVAGGEILLASVTVVDQGMALRLPSLYRLLQGVDDKAGVHAAADPPAYDVTSKGIRDEGYVGETLPDRNMRYV
jgi:hypothetical protein